jgi:hypothetical protein
LDQQKKLVTLALKITSYQKNLDGRKVANLAEKKNLNGPWKKEAAKQPKPNKEQVKVGGFGAV